LGGAGGVAGATVGPAAASVGDVMGFDVGLTETTLAALSARKASLASEGL